MVSKPGSAIAGDELGQVLQETGMSEEELVGLLDLRQALPG
jgi:hypothetical protein